MRRMELIKLAARLIGWYSTRLIVVIIWCGVFWSILGNLIYPTGIGINDETNSDVRCLPFAAFPTINETLFQGDFTQTYLLLCNETRFHYCVVTLTINESCPSQISITIESNTNGTNLSNDSVYFSYDVNQAIYQQLNPSVSPPTSLADVTNGHFFSLIILVLCSAVGGFFVNLVKLPPLLGMMAAGFILQNVPGNIIGSINPVWSSTLRNLALAIILIRGGLALDAKKLWSVKFVLPLLAILPCVAEGSLDSIIAIFYLKMPWQWGLTAG